MQKFDKKTALSLGAVIVAIILVLLMTRKGGNVVYQSNGAGGTTIIGGVSIPGLTMDIPRYEFTIPAFALPEDQFSMISGCCSDCSKGGPVTSYLPAYSGNTYVFNEGNKAGEVFNYYEAPKVDPYANINFNNVGGNTWMSSYR